MSLRTHAVIVQPDRYPGGPADLARLLAPITGSDLGPLTEALGRGPMTVEADLSAADALALANRLSDLGVPAEVQPPATDESAAPGAIEAERARITDEVPRQRSRTMLGMNPSAGEQPAEPADGWASVFPDLKPPTDSTAPHTPPVPSPPVPSRQARSPQTPSPPSTEEKAPSLDVLEAPIERTPPLGSGPIIAPPPPEADRVAADTIGSPTAPDPAPAQPPAQAASLGRPSSRSRKALKPDGFDPAKLSALLPAEASVEKQAPFRPKGFDPRPEHHPPFAVAFAVLAPGAGHVFNGDDEEGMALGLRFWMVLPWVRSIAQVRDQAEKIRTHWAERPEDGSGFRALRYAAGWWLAVILIVSSIAWAVPTVLRVSDREPEQVGPTPETIVAAFESANTRVLGARVRALDALQFAQKDLEPTPKYSMSDEERAERLYSIGYHECAQRGHSMCEEMMKRILELRPAFGPAIKLQTWASLAQRGGAKVPLPDVGTVPTLSDLELQKWRHEMILQGERVPVPDKKPQGELPDTELPAAAQPEAAQPESEPVPENAPDWQGTNQ